MYIIQGAPLAQSVERESHNLKVASSILAGSTNLFAFCWFCVVYPYFLVRAFFLLLVSANHSSYDNVIHRMYLDIPDSPTILIITQATIHMCICHIKSPIDFLTRFRVTHFCLPVKDCIGNRAGVW